MKRKVISVILIMICLSFAGCSNDDVDIVRLWEAGTISLEEGTEEAITHYLWLAITSEQVIGIPQFSETHDRFEYEIDSGNRILIGDKSYEITLKKNEMILRNEKMEIHYSKVGK